MAELIDKLFDQYGVEVLGFDIVWAERDTSSGIDSARRAGAEGPEAGAGIPGRASKRCGPGSTTTSFSPRRSRAGRSCWATTSAAKSARPASTRFPSRCCRRARSPVATSRFTTVDGLYRQSAGLPEERRRAPAISIRGRRRRRHRAACRCSPNSTARTTRRFRSRSCVPTLRGTERAGSRRSSRATRGRRAQPTAAPGMAQGRAAAASRSTTRRPR